ncbi:MAG TPA: LrgB family protein, partial [Gemmatimonadaceae bacterium]|nr:LrgB family protein [Gemmatimonadaceae bacterium]
RWAYARTRLTLLSPAIVAIVVLIVALALTGTSYAEYERGARVLTWLLGPAVVAIGVPLAAELESVKRDLRRILAAIVVAAVVGALGAMGTALALGASPSVVRSLAPRSVTTPIAMAVSAQVGGVPALSAVVVIATGLLGGVIGPALLRRIGVQRRAAVGLALGAAAHGLGTARAVEEGRVEGAMSGLAMGLTGIVTALLAPALVALLAWLFSGRV